MQKRKIFIGGNQYLISSLDLKIKDENITKWPAYYKTETLSKLINKTKKEIFIKFKPGNGSHVTKQHQLRKKTNISIKRTRKSYVQIHKYGNKKIDAITFQSFQKLFLENNMTLKDSKDEFIYTIRGLPVQNTNQYEQIITKKFNENAYLDRLNRENTFWVT